MNHLSEIALNTGPVVVIDAQARWAGEFKVAGTQLRNVLGTSALRIDHIGSTSVPGLAAKDIVDIQITVESLDNLAFFEEKMLAAGYQKRGTYHHDCLVGIDDPLSPQLRKAYFREPEGQRRCHLHVRQKGLLNQRYALLFRDFLRANAKVRMGYETIKRRLTEIFPESIDGYLYIKDPLMDIIHQGGESWALTVGWTPDELYL